MHEQLPGRLKFAIREQHAIRISELRRERLSVQGPIRGLEGRFGDDFR